MNVCDSHLCHNCSPINSQSFYDGRHRKEMVAGGRQESHTTDLCCVGELRLVCWLVTRLCLAPVVYRAEGCCRDLRAPEKGNRTQWSRKVRHERRGVQEGRRLTGVGECTPSELGDQLRYFHQVGLVFNYLCGNPSSTFLHESKSTGCEAGMMSLSCCTYSLFLIECSSDPHLCLSSSISHDWWDLSDLQEFIFPLLHNGLASIVLQTCMRHWEEESMKSQLNVLGAHWVAVVCVEESTTKSLNIPLS